MAMAPRHALRHRELHVRVDPMTDQSHAARRGGLMEERDGNDRHLGD